MLGAYRCVVSATGEDTEAQKGQVSVRAQFTLPAGWLQGRHSQPGLHCFLCPREPHIPGGEALHTPEAVRNPQDSQPSTLLSSHRGICLNDISQYE